MVWTYRDPSLGGHHEIRFLIGDTVAATPLLSDGEINYVIAQGLSTYESAARCCEAIAAKLAQEVNIAVTGEMQAQLGQRRGAFLAQAAVLRLQVGKLAMPFAGGIDQASKDLYSQDSSRVGSVFWRGQGRFRGLAPVGQPAHEETEP